jgi:hypothetical protein
MDFDFLIPISVFVVIAYIVKVISDNRVRSRLIEKGALDENVKHLYWGKRSSSHQTSLKWGLVCIGVGLGLFIGQLFPHRVNDEMSIGFMFALAGVGLMIFYFIAKRSTSVNKEEELVSEK